MNKSSHDNFGNQERREKEKGRRKEKSVYAGFFPERGGGGKISDTANRV